MYDKFEPNGYYSADTLNIVNKPYLDYCSRKSSHFTIKIVFCMFLRYFLMRSVHI